MPLKVIGAGLGRTGTMSLKFALEQLGFGPCHHMSEIILNPESTPLWIKAAEGRPDWEAIFRGYASGVDAPTCIFWRELAAIYPTAKVILSVRDANSWYDSILSTFQAATQLRASQPLTEFFEKVIIPGMGEGGPAKIHDRNFMVDYFNRYNAEVERLLSKDRLLIFDAIQGWAPLCKFFDVPVPGTPFPRANTREDFFKKNLPKEPDEKSTARH